MDSLKFTSWEQTLLIGLWYSGMGSSKRRCLGNGGSDLGLIRSGTFYRPRSFTRYIPEGHSLIWSSQVIVRRKSETARESTGREGGRELHSLSPPFPARTVFPAHFSLPFIGSWPPGEFKGHRCVLSLKIDAEKLIDFKLKAQRKMSLAFKE